MAVSIYFCDQIVPLAKLIQKDNNTLSDRADMVLSIARMIIHTKGLLL